MNERVLLKLAVAIFVLACLHFLLAPFDHWRLGKGRLGVFTMGEALV